MAERCRAGARRCLRGRILARNGVSDGSRTADERCEVSLHLSLEAGELLPNNQSLIGICGSPGCSNGHIGRVSENMFRATTRLFPKTVK